jgi:hypothetical protein
MFVCLLNKHSGSISSIADFIFPLILTGRETLAVILLYKEGAGSLFSDTASVSIYFFTLFLRGPMTRS